MLVLDRKTKERLLNKIKIGDGCWEWQGSKDKSGYGVFSMKNSSGLHKGFRAHRVTYEVLIGDIPDGLVIDHLCRNTSCVNPTHLEPVTNAENIRRGESGIHEKSKTRCPKFHPYDKENTRYDVRKNGNIKRYCFECYKIKMIQSAARAKHRKEEKESRIIIGAKDRTHCPKNHPYNSDNTYYDSNGHRECKTCVAEAGKKRYAKKLEKLNKVYKKDRTHCTNGHLFTDSDYAKNGHRRCKQCARQSYERTMERRKSESDKLLDSGEV
jgi:hypothetical protein